jgi:cellulose biosynthesis protein BcsQ
VTAGAMRPEQTLVRNPPTSNIALPAPPSPTPYARAGGVQPPRPNLLGELFRLVLSDEMTEQLYASPDGLPEIDSLKEVLAPLLQGDASLGHKHKIAAPATNRFGISVLPGHPQIALLEDLLSTNWQQFMRDVLGGLRVTNWNTQLLSHVTPLYDLIIYDVGPSLGALNRSILIGVDYFMAPMGCDIFSLIGIENIADWVGRWRRVYDPAFARIQASFPNAPHEFAGQIRVTS